MEKQTTVKLVSAVILRDNRVLLGLRINTQHFNHHWSLPIGHVERNESNIDAIYRELKEELAIEQVCISELTVKIDRDKNIYQQVYLVKKWQGQIVNAEPHLCEQLRWYKLTELPQDITPISYEIINEIMATGLIKT
ncbi:MAG: NUDIX domain-containing protein [Kangiellaceae bacterium]|nr:NUDIX domain-containing protein [Kangiellaceae bacterium]